MSHPLRRCAVTGGLYLALGCALGGVPDREVPESPIAISYLTPEEARRRAEDHEDAAEQGQASSARPSRLGRADLVASEDNITEVFSRLLGRSEPEKDEHVGRLALLHPRTLKVEVIVAARRGSIPLDWSPDRQRLLFSQPQDRDFQIYEYDRADETVRAVTHGPPAHTQGCYGPDGRIVAVAVDARKEPVRSEIVVSHPGGRGPFRPLTAGPSDHSPTCDPNGDGVAFVREEDPPRAEIYFTRTQPGAPVRRLSPGRHPAFSPDGEWVAFSAPVKRELRLWRIRPDGSGRSPIGRGARHEARPAVSPDGRLVAYVAAEEQPRRHLYLRRIDGSGDRILFADGDGQFPVW